MYNHQPKKNQGYHEQQESAHRTRADQRDDYYHADDYDRDSQQREQVNDFLLPESDERFRGYSDGAYTVFEPGEETWSTQHYEDPHARDQYYRDHYHTDQHYRETPYPGEQYAEVQYSDESYTGTDANDRSHNNDVYAQEVAGYRNEFSEADSEGYNDNYHADHFDSQSFDSQSFDTQGFDTQSFDTQSFESRDFTGAEYGESDLTDPDFAVYTHGQPGALYADDFKDVGHQGKNRFIASLGKLAAGIGIAIFTVGFAALAMFASKPPMTPAEIVQMDGYQGTETHRPYYFNLASLRDCNTIQDCDGVVQANNSTPSQTTTTFGKNANASSAGSDAVSTMTNYREIPAVATSSDNQTGRTPADSKQWSVRKQWSNVREAPELSSPIITSLAANTPVTVISEVGEWIEITSNRDGLKSVVTGFMHKSLLQADSP